VRLGDVYETVGFAAFAAAAYIAFGLAPALAVVGVCLVYLGQCWGATPLPKPKFPRRKKPATEDDDGMAVS